MEADMDSGSLVSHIKPNWIMRKQLSFASTLEWEFIFIEEDSS